MSSVADIREMARRNVAGAVQAVLESPPYAGEDGAKNEWGEMVIAACGGRVAANDMANILDSLDGQQLDDLMRGIYRALSLPELAGKSIAGLFKWHEALLKKAGVGSIVRVMSQTQFYL